MTQREYVQMGPNFLSIDIRTVDTISLQSWCIIKNIAKVRMYLRDGFKDTLSMSMWKFFSFGSIHKNIPLAVL